METLRFDSLVIGSGIAGLWFAHRASRFGTVLVITKKEDTESNTNYAQGGIAVALAEDDSPEIHFRDTIETGQGLAHPDIVRLVVGSGPALVRDLFALGVAFETYHDAQGTVRFDLGREGGHHRRRIVHARDRTGAEIENGLVRAVRAAARVTMLEQHFALEALVDRNGRCCGALVLDCATGRVKTVFARAVVMATGGLGQAYRHTTNPRIATGDGIALGYRAGAAVANMEFIQFHPTALCGSDIDGRAFLVSEAVRGEGAVLRTKDGRTFMERYHPDGCLASRDVVALAIDSELKQRGEEYVLLDATLLDPARMRERFPVICETCLRFGYDITREPVPVVPAAHYACGGLKVNEWAETAVPGLMAVGESACTGLHGANRLASNSLLEALVFADRAAMRAAEYVAREGRQKEVTGEAEREASDVLGQYTPADTASEREATKLRQELGRVMWNIAGIVRSDAGLAQAARLLAEMEEKAGAELRRLSVVCCETANLITVSRLVVECAQCRHESRGLHYNADHPQKDAQYEKDTVVRK